MGTLTLDLAIPAHNEEDVILPTIELISEALREIPHLSWRIIVAENGSQDNTYTVVKNSGLAHVSVFSANSQGKGAAIKEAAQHSTAEYFGFIDADCSPHPRAIKDMLCAFEKPGVALVVGSRFHPESSVDRDFFRHGTSRMFNLLARAIVGIDVSDTQCGLKIMNQHGKRILAACKEDTWFCDLELIARIERAGHAISIVPVEWTEFRYPNRKSKLNVASDGIRAIVHMIQMRKRLRNELRHCNKIT